VVQIMSAIRKDFIASSLRSQLNRLNRILSTVEEEQIDCDYAYESLREIESHLRQIRKLCVSG